MAVSPAIEQFRPSPDVLTPAPSADRSKDMTRQTMFADSNDEPSFWDLLDVINPLQHIPIVSDIYRELTGDKIGAGARVAGGALFGGLIGLGAAVVNLIVEEKTGNDIGGNVMALFSDPAAEGAQTRLAEAPVAPSDSAPAALAALASRAEPAPEVVPAPTQTAMSSPAESKSPALGAPEATVPPPSFVMPLGFGSVSEPSPQKLTQAAPATFETASNPSRSLPLSLIGAQLASPLQLTTVQEQAGQAVAAQNLAAQAGTGQANGPNFRPLNRAAASPSRFMPLPPRPNATPAVARDSAQPASTIQAATAQPATSNATPGANPLDPAVAQRILMEQGVAQGAHPLMPAAAKTPGEASPDWFVTNMNRALDKYEQGNRLGKERR